MTTSANRENIEEWNDMLAVRLIPDSVVLGIYMIVGLLGNSVVIFLHKYRLKKFSDDRFFIPYLAFVDLMSCVLNTTFSISINSLAVKYENGSACKTMWFLCMTFTMASAFMLVVIAIHRYLKICRPFGLQMKLKQKRIALAIVGMISIFISWPSFLFYGPKPVSDVYTNSTNITGYRCTNIRGPWSSTEPLVVKTSLLILVVICLIVLIVTYALIGRVIHRQITFRKRSKFAPTTESLDKTKGKTENTRKDNVDTSLGTTESVTGVLSTDTTMNANEIKCHKDIPSLSERKKGAVGVRFTVVFMLITLIFILTYMPKLGMMIYESRVEHFWTELSSQELAGYRFLYTLFIINNIVNPFIYGYFDKQFRDEFIKMFCRCKSLSK